MVKQCKGGCNLQHCFAQPQSLGIQPLNNNRTEGNLLLVRDILPGQARDGTRNLWFNHSRYFLWNTQDNTVVTTNRNFSPLVYDYSQVYSSSHTRITCCVHVEYFLVADGSYHETSHTINKCTSTRLYILDSMSIWHIYFSSDNQYQI